MRFLIFIGEVGMALYHSKYRNKEDLDCEIYHNLLYYQNTYNNSNVYKLSQISEHDCISRETTFP
jgi:hypothetical protein